MQRDGVGNNDVEISAWSRLSLQKVQCLWLCACYLVCDIVYVAVSGTSVRSNALPGP